MKKWHFPLINPVRKFSIKHFTDHVNEEVDEFKQEKDLAKKAKECVDVLHAAETLVRKFFLQHPELDVEKIKKQIIDKNKKRGYYSY
jgi:uncharacterized caspase-like protein